jgi:flagellar biosynthesis regulator FlbT
MGRAPKHSLPIPPAEVYDRYLIAAIAQQVSNGLLYKALKGIRKLTQRERNLLAV